MNLTGVPLRMQFRRQREDAIPLIDMTTTNFKIVVSSPTQGVVDLVLNDNDTERLPAGTVYWDLIRTDTKQRLCGGHAMVEQGVTR